MNVENRLIFQNSRLYKGAATALLNASIFELLNFSRIIVLQIFNGMKDCSDLSDECPMSMEHRKENVFSSRFQLIANPILRGIVWLMGVLACVGNIVSLKHCFIQFFTV